MAKMLTMDKTIQGRSELVMKKTVWFITGSQHLYGEEALKQVAINSRVIAEYINQHMEGLCDIIFKGVVSTPNEITEVCREVNADDNCIGVITWMHTFSPAKMWINGLTKLNKPQLHLNTQYNKALPWDKIDMDFMNLNQSAHGDLEYGFINARLRLPRKVVVGHWQDEEVINEIKAWVRVASSIYASKNTKVARFGDNMRYVAVTEGDKVEAEIKLGWSVNGYGVGDLVEYVKRVDEKEIDKLMEEYKEKYTINTDNIASVRYQARLEIAIEKFLTDGGFNAFTTTFENLHGLEQLPGLAAQRLMEKGYGFGAEGDWKLSALTYVLKSMGKGLPGGTAFMENYTYHLEKDNESVLGAHMLEICPTLAQGEVKIEVHPLSIGGKADPARFVFNGLTGPGLMVTLVDMGDRFRMIVNKVELLPIPQAMPKLPVARVLWKPLPNLKDATAAWIYAGGAHHSVLTTQLTVEDLRLFAKYLDIEFVLIDENLDLAKFEQELMINDVIWKLKGIK